MMMQTAIEEALKRDPYTSKIYGGVFASNELPDQVAYPSCYVLNTKPRTHEGEHWLAVYYDDKGHGSFFDSYGMPPSAHRFESFMDRTSQTWSFNNIRVQGHSSFCGYYCLLYLFERARGSSRNFFAYFNKNYIQNDKKVEFYLNLFKNNKTRINC